MTAKSIVLPCFVFARVGDASVLYVFGKVVYLRLDSIFYLFGFVWRKKTWNSKK